MTDAPGTIRDGSRVGDVRDGGKGWLVKRHHGRPMGDTYALGHTQLPGGREVSVWATSEQNASWFRTSKQARDWMTRWCSTGDPSSPHVTPVSLPDGTRGAR